MGRPLHLAVAVAMGAFLAFAPHSALAQPSQGLARGARAATVMAGMGNAMGWLGVQGERYLARERLSLFGGLGYTPEFELVPSGERCPSGVAAAAGVRGYTRGQKHRAYLELSVSQIQLETIGPETPEGAHRYGPGIQIGYQYVGVRGFTVSLSAGVGYALGTSTGGEPVEPLGGLGVGYTWRR